MQFPSLQHIAEKTTATLKRFPLVLLSATIGVGVAIFLAGDPAAETNFLFNIVLITILGIPLFTVVQLAAEQHSWSPSMKTGISAGAFLLLLGYLFTLPADLDQAPHKFVYRYLLYFLGVHLLVAVAPYAGERQINAFWQYNKTLFLRFLTSVFFSAVLFVGLAVALVSVEFLLEVDVEDIRYFQLFITLAGLFNTWFFLAGIPPSKQIFSSSDRYPKGLKVFTQNILIPLVIIYLLILYLYTGKIILQWSWPEGWIAYLVLSFSITGILALLLLHPIRELAENRWIKTFSASFFWALVPLVILLLLAILRRIWEYSFTIERYFVLILGLWLAGIVLYFLIGNRQNIKVIPASLCVLVFLISFGSWGAFSVPERSQINRLESYLHKNNLLQNGTIRQATSDIAFDDRQQISSIIRYLNENHGLEGIQPWFSQDLDSLQWQRTEDSAKEPVPYYQRPEEVTKLLGIEYVGRGASVPEAALRNEFHAEEGKPLDVSDARFLIRDLYWSENKKRQQFTLPDNRTLIIESNKEAPHIRLYFPGEKTQAIGINMMAMIDSLSAKFHDGQTALPPGAMRYNYKSDSLSATLYFENILWRQDEKRDLIRVHYLVGIR